MRVCARVLAAALMTGAITAGLTLPSLTSEPGGVPRAVPAPPLSHGRTLHLPALSKPVPRSPAPRNVSVHAQPKRLAVTHSASRPSTVVLRPQLASVRTPVAPKPTPKPAPRPVPTPTTPAPAPAPAAVPAERELASDAAPPPAAPAPAQTSDQSCGGESDDDGHGHGHANGHDKGDNENASDEAEGHGNGTGNENGKANGHDK